MAGLNWMERSRKFLVIIPLLISYFAYINESWELVLIYAVSVFLVILMIPEFKHYENLGMCFMIFICSIPINIWFSEKLLKELFDPNESYLSMLYRILLWIILYSLEELTFGIMTRLIWKKQYKLDF